MVHIAVIRNVKCVKNFVAFRNKNNGLVKIKVLEVICNEITVKRNTLYRKIFLLSDRKQN